jgi:hypothetical protein
MFAITEKNRQARERILHKMSEKKVVHVDKGIGNNATIQCWDDSTVYVRCGEFCSIIPYTWSDFEEIFGRSLS